MNTRTIVITGAAGNIGYSLAFRVAAGELLGEEPIILKLVEPFENLLDGLRMEFEDSVFPNLQDLVVTTSLDEGFKDADAIFLVGARPRSKGMERKDLLYVNAPIFKSQGEAISSCATPGVKVLVVANPANTNALILQTHAPALDSTQISCMTQLDHNRAVACLAGKLGIHRQNIHNVIIWGNHSSTQFPDCTYCRFSNGNKIDVFPEWQREYLVPFVQQRGAKVIQARGSSSAASAASAAMMHMRTWLSHTEPNDWTSMGIKNDGGYYEIDKDLFFSFPVVVEGGAHRIVDGLPLSVYQREMLKITETELCEERDAVADFLK